MKFQITNHTRRLLASLLISIFLILCLKFMLYNEVNDILARFLILIPSLIALILSKNTKYLYFLPRVEHSRIVSFAPFAAYFVIVINLISSIITCVIIKSIPQNTPYLLLLCAIIGLLEELIFRGIIIGNSFNNEKTLFIALILSSLLFGISHYNYGNIQMIITNTGFGFVYGVVFIKTQSLLIPSLLHFLYDFSILWSDSISTQTENVSEQINRVASNNDDVIMPIIIMTFNIAISLIAFKKAKPNSN